MNFLRSFAEHLRAFLTFVQTQEENQREIKDLRAQVEELGQTTQILALALRHELQNERHEREKFMLQVELELARRLPPKNDA